MNNPCILAMPDVARTGNAVAIEPRVLGIDPGKFGAIACLDGADLEVWDVPLVGNAINVPEFARLIRAAAPAFAVIEAVGARPSQGTVSMFSFGRAYGTALGVVGTLGIPLHTVPPAVWKRAYRLTGKPKDASREFAVNTWPNAAELFRFKKAVGRADATILALFGRDFLWRRTSA